MKQLLPAVLIYATLWVPACSTPAGREGDPKNVSDNGVHIDYTDTGKGDTTLFFVHGWCLDKSYWDDQAAFFKNRYRIVAMDLPGFGASGKNRKIWSTEHYANDVDSLMTALDLHHVFLVGHSMAGNIILLAAHQDSTRILGIAGADNFKDIGQQETPDEKKQSAVFMDQLRHQYTALADQYFNEALFSPTTPAAVKKRILQNVHQADSSIAVDALEAESPDALVLLRSLHKKLYLISSDRTPTDTSVLVANHLPFRIFYVPGSGHFPMVEQPQLFNQHLQAALDDLTRNK